MSCDHAEGSFRGMKLLETTGDEILYGCPACGATARAARCMATSAKTRLRCKSPSRGLYCATHRKYAVSSTMRSRWQEDRDADSSAGREVRGSVPYGYAYGNGRSARGRARSRGGGRR